MADQSQPSIHEEKDPAHPSQPNQDHTGADGEKPKDIMSAIADTEFMPTLDEAPASQHARSHLLLLVGLFGAVFSAWFMGFELFQTNESWTTLAVGGSGVVAAGLAVMWFTDALWIDWWAVITGYWWLSLPVAGAAGIILVLMQEQAATWSETD